MDILKTGSSNIYAVNSEIVWRDTANQKKYAHFTAKVYLLSDEQEDEVKVKLFGHATVESKPELKDKRKKRESKAITFEEKILPLNIKEFIKKGYVYVGETDNAYELNDKKGTLTIIPK
jgi:hypothetical protein